MWIAQFITHRVITISPRESILEARELGLAGATVARGIMGFGATSRVHTAKMLRLSDDLPIVVEIVDTQEKLDKIMQFMDDNVTEGLITLEKVKVIKYRYKNRG